MRYMKWLIEKNLVPGAIITLHDGISDPARSIRTLPDILTVGRKRGLRFVSIGALMKEARCRCVDRLGLSGICPTRLICEGRLSSISGLFT
jgi:hypothetical protein